MPGEFATQTPTLRNTHPLKYTHTHSQRFACFNYCVQARPQVPGLSSGSIDDDEDVCMCAKERVFSDTWYTSNADACFCPCQRAITCVYRSAQQVCVYICCANNGLFVDSGLSVHFVACRGSWLNDSRYPVFSVSRHLTFFLQSVTYLWRGLFLTVSTSFCPFFFSVPADLCFLRPGWVSGLY